MTNMGVRKSEHWGTWEVSYCYYGVTNADGSYLDDGGGTPIKPKARWSIEVIVPNTAAAANELWALRDIITETVAREDPKVPKESGAKHGAFGFLVDVWGADRAGVPQARLRASKGEQGRWVISEYDWNRWTATL